MPIRRTRTALYSEAARRRLGQAVTKARELAGYKTTAELARATGRAPRAIYALENGEPTVGQSVLQAVGRTLGERLSGWDEDSPRRILEGGDPPPASERSAPQQTTGPDKAGAGDEERALVRALIRRGWSPEQINEVLDELERGKSALPPVEPPTETNRERNAISHRRSSDTGT